MGEGGLRSFGEPARRPPTFPPEKRMLDSTSQPLAEDFRGVVDPVRSFPQLMTVATIIITAHTAMGTSLGPSQVLTQLLRLGP